MNFRSDTPSGRVNDPSKFASSSSSTLMWSPANTSMTGISLIVTITEALPSTRPLSPVPVMVTSAKNGEPSSSS